MKSLLRACSGLGLLLLAACSSKESGSDDDVEAVQGEDTSVEGPSNVGGSSGVGGANPVGGTGGTEPAPSNVAGSPAAVAGAAAEGGAGGVANPPVLPPSDVLVGNFVVTLVPPNDSTGTAGLSSMQGNVRDGALNETTAWELVDEAGPCELWKPTIPFCDPNCPAGEACVSGDVCRAHPEPMNVGMVTVFGLDTLEGSAEFIVNPTGPNFNYLPPASVDLAYPPSAEGAEVRVAASGGEYPPFEITSSGIAPLAVDSDEALPVVLGEPLPVSWTAPGAASMTRMEVLVDISHHGGAKGKITCDTEDTGSLSIDASLVSQLVDFGFAGFPTVKLSRKAVGATTIAQGRVELTLVSHHEVPLSIPGLVSCGGDADCEAPQTCLTDRTCG